MAELGADLEKALRVQEYDANVSWMRQGLRDGMTWANAAEINKVRDIVQGVIDDKRLRLPQDVDRLASAYEGTSPNFKKISYYHAWSIAIGLVWERRGPMAEAKPTFFDLF